jgi:hypothetical protein
MLHDLDKYPNTVLEQARRFAENNLFIVVDADFYAGQFFNEDQLQRLMSQVRSRPVVLVEIESIREAPPDEGGTFSRTSDLQGSRDRITVNAYVGVSNVRDEGEQFRTSSQIANDLRSKIVGTEVPATAQHSNGHWKFDAVEKEFSVHGLSVHTLIIYVDVYYDLQTG